MLTLFFGLAGAYLAGAKGGAWGFAVAGALKTVNAWWQFSLALREYESGRSEAGRGVLMRTICRRRPADQGARLRSPHETPAVRLCVRAGSRK